MNSSSEIDSSLNSKLSSMLDLTSFNKSKLNNSKPSFEVLNPKPPLNISELEKEDITALYKNGNLVIEDLTLQLVFQQHPKNNPYFLPRVFF